MIERQKCPACGIEYEVGEMGHLTFFTSFRPDKPTSEEFVFAKICRFAKRPGECVNTKGQNPVPPIDGFMKMAKELRDELDDNDNNK